MLILAVVAGGATWQVNAGDAWVVLPAIVLLSLAVGAHLLRQRIDLAPLALTFATLLIPWIQIAPWPGEAPPWSAVHRALHFDHALVFGIDPTRTLSVAPDATWRAFLAMLPPTAVFLSMLLLSAGHLRRLAVLVVALAMISAVWGIVQVTMGDVPLPGFFDASDGQARGFFSNRNHFAAQMYVGIALGGAGLVLAVRRMLADPEPARHGPRVVAWAIGFLLLVVGCMVAQSRAGVILGAGVVLSMFVVILIDTARAARGSRRVVVIVVTLAFLMAVQSGLWGVLDRFKSDPFEDGRVVVQSTTWQLARDAAPWGTGLGTFRRVYEQREPPESVIAAYVNRAHNDWLEFYLETGYLGVALVVLWAIWLIRASWRAARADAASGDSSFGLIRRLAVVALAAVALHSLVDFPMRTIAMATTVAALVVLAVGPRGDGTVRRRPVPAEGDRPIRRLQK